MKPVCVPCRRFFRIVKSGFYFIEGMPNGNEAKPGWDEPEKWSPYKVWSGDLWRCAGCGAEIVNGVGLAPLSEHYKSGFAQVVTDTGADQLQVNDC
ncbi:MAG: hypothetical protein V4792_16820 [Pseudomonadota bacterium]